MCQTVSFVCILVVILIVAIYFFSRPESQCRVNGIEGACSLTLNEFTLAGSHNSASGAYGSLYHWGGIKASDCIRRNQRLSITEQLQMGIRYFDFDVGYNTAGTRGPSGWWDLGILLVHCTAGFCAYTKSFMRAMQEIDQFLANNTHDVVVVRMKDNPEWARESIKANLGKELQYFSLPRQNASVRLSEKRNPVLGEAIEKNERIVLFINSDFWMELPKTHKLSQVESEYGPGTFQCYQVQEVAESIIGNIQSLDKEHMQVEVDWYLSYGLCRDDLAGLCDGNELFKIKSIYKEVVRETDRPVNLVMIDYVGGGNIRLKDIVEDINKCNVFVYKYGHHVDSCKL